MRRVPEATGSFSLRELRWGQPLLSVLDEMKIWLLLCLPINEIGSNGKDGVVLVLLNSVSLLGVRTDPDPEISVLISRDL
jgi:hypothetical protein